MTRLALEVEEEREARRREDWPSLLPVREGWPSLLPWLDSGRKAVRPTVTQGPWLMEERPLGLAVMVAGWVEETVRLALEVEEEREGRRREGWPSRLPGRGIGAEWASS